MKDIKATISPKKGQDIEIEEETTIAEPRNNRQRRFSTSRGQGGRSEQQPDEFDQKIIDIARVTRVMAGGKRRRFRACVAIGDHKGRVAIGLAKGLDVTTAVNKAVNQAKKSLITVPIINGTIPHEVRQKSDAAIIILKPATQGKGIIAGSVVRIILELAGLHNVTSKMIGSHNKVNNAKCTMKALQSLKKPVRQDKQDKNVATADSAKSSKKVVPAAAKA